MSLHSNMFGWDYVWRDFADARGGEVITEGRDGSGDVLAVIVPTDLGPVTFTPVSSGTAAAIAYDAQCDFAFNLYKQKPLDSVSKVFGMQDIVIGDTNFDKQFVIQSNNPTALTNILKHAGLRDLLMLEDTADIRNLPSNAAFDPRWSIPAGHSAVVYNRLAMIDKHDQLDGVLKVLYTFVALMNAEGVSGAATNVGSDGPVSKRLHSPLLNR